MSDIQHLFTTYNAAEIGIAAINPDAESLLLQAPELAVGIHPNWHQRRKTEWLTSRLLLQKVSGQAIDALQYTSEGKPYFSDGSKTSISHSKQMAAVIWHPNREVGIDIEEIRPQVSKIHHKFLSEAEKNRVDTQNITLLTALWCAKEALYKLYGFKALQFNQHILLNKLNLHITNEQHLKGTIEAQVIAKQISIDARVQIEQYGNNILAYIVL